MIKSNMCNIGFDNNSIIKPHRYHKYQTKQRLFIAKIPC